MSSVKLTWPGFDAAVDLIAAQCQSTSRVGIYTPSRSGTVLAIALADRLALPYLKKPEDSMLLVEAWAWNRSLAETAYTYKDAEIWVWLDTTDGFYNSVCKMSGVSCVAMPWQDMTLGCLEHFLPTFHD